MLLDFTFGNFGPFRDDVTLSMEATGGSEHRNNLIAGTEDILSSAIVFGPNAAGKTFIVEALWSLRNLVSRVDANRGPPNYNPFRLSKDTRESPVRMRMRLLLDGVKYDYRVEYLRDSIVSENLYHYPRGRRARVFERNGDVYTGGKKRIIKSTSDSVTYLAMASVLSDPLCSKVRDAMVKDIIILPPELDVLIQDSCRFSSSDPERKDRALKALDAADFGVSDFTFKERKIKSPEVKGAVPQDFSDRANDSLTNQDIFIKHGFTDDDYDEEGLTFPIELESSGTQCMFGLISPIIDAMESGKLVVMDELGAHLHPMLTHWIVSQFSSENNPNGAQLIANTHDISLMDTSELLRRDQIWFVNKSRSKGVSVLYCLSDFDGVRKDTDVMKGYLLGRYDAVPLVLHRGVIE